MNLRFRIIVICMLCTLQSIHAQIANPNFKIGNRTEKYSFDYTQTPDQLIELNSPFFGSVSFKYQWEESAKPFTATNTDVAETETTADYIFSAPLTQTMYYRQRVTNQNDGSFVYSDVIKLQIVSINWEDKNYMREHDILTQGITDWQTVDRLHIGDKLQTTTYIDGNGRMAEKVSQETASPREDGDGWGDVVQFGTSNYDIYGREAKQYLPYTSYSKPETGKYKSNSLEEQNAYYTHDYGEESPYTNITYENSPLSRVQKVNAPGTSWATSQGNSSLYELNDENDHVKIFTIDYESGDYPVTTSEYEPGTLYRTTSIDEKGKYFIQFTNKEGQLILTKEQTELDYSHGIPSLNGYNGYICVYSVYDDFGLLRYRLQPEAVDYLTRNEWSFDSRDGQTVLQELCFRYEYDDKGRTILKKAPGASPLRMLYDSRDRVVYMQDGNQAAKQPAEWTVNLYDDLDRLVITALYQNGGITTEELQHNIDIADGVSSTIEINDEQRGAITVTLLGSPISSEELNNSRNCTIVKYLFYDNYSFTGVHIFDTRSNNIEAYQTGQDPNILRLESSNRTLSFPTGSLVRILGTPTFLASTDYYDEKGNHVQSTEENMRGGTDVTTLQYHWDGRLLSTDKKHIAEERNGIVNLDIITKNIFDNIGRLTSLQKKYNDNEFKTIATYDFDDMGRLKTKHLDPGYTGNDGNGGREMESLTYSYNIHNNITGINKDYALKTEGVYSKWAHFFGLYLGYDNRDMVFNASQLDGHVTGQLWNTQGDDAQRKYDYGYDFAGRLRDASSTEKNTTDEYWNGRTNFSVKAEYDLNGNLLTMSQIGILPGSSGSDVIDDLHYTYASYSNKLLKVTDNNNGTTNGMQGDFKGSQNAVDYDYDDNGNIITDRNKGANKLPEEADGRGISYNFLDKPEKIHIEGKGTIQFVYDADGNKLQKIFTPEGENNTPVTTTYINEFVYKNDDLQYINFEEGRIRMIKPVNTSNGYDALSIGGGMSLGGEKIGVYDYFIRDYQNNVRMIVTEEEHYGNNKCTMETGRAGEEEPIFGQVDANGQPTTDNEVKKTRFAVSTIPGQTSGGGWQNESIQSNVSRVGALAASKTGPNVLLKVMAGDVLNATTQYYYQNYGTSNTQNTNLTMSVLTSLIAAISESPATSSLAKGSTGYIEKSLDNNNAFDAITAPSETDATTDYPKAYLTVLFFDERFNFVSESSATYRVKPEDKGSSNASLTFEQPAKAPKNGYAFVYVSNESDEPVYFDNLNISDTRGKLVEEDHYYPFGLKIAAISSEKMGDPNEGMLENKNLFNDKELTDDADLDWYDYGFRNYDAQIGRFMQLDPWADDYPEQSPYVYAANEPVGNTDVDGLAPGGNLLTGVTVYSTVKTVAKAGISAAQIGNFALKALDFATDFLPFVGGAKDIYRGIRDGNVMQVAIGASSIVLDAVTMGTSSVGEGIAKTVAKDVIGQSGKEVVESVARETAEDIGKRSVEKASSRSASSAEESLVKDAEKKFKPPCTCFLAGTLVLTDSGYKPIEKIKVGDKVKAYNDTTHTFGLKKVVSVYEHERDTLYQLHIGRETISTTSDHPFYVNGRWQHVVKLRAGDSVVTYKGRKIAIDSITLVVGRITVHNLQVAGYHTYYVSRQGVLVHNSTPCPNSPGPGGKTPRLKSTKQLRKEWEEGTKQDWPKEPNDANRNQVAHHIKALADKGHDGYPNIQPIPAETHHLLHKVRGDFVRWATKVKP